MSQMPTPNWQPQYAAPQPVLPYHTPPAQGRPVSATVIAIIGIVYASLWVLGSLGSIVVIIFLSNMFSAINKMGAAAGPGAAPVPNLAHLLAWQITSSVVSLLVMALLLTMTIGLLRNVRWSRKGMMAYAIINLAWLGVSTILQVMWLMPLVNASAGGGAKTSLYGTPTAMSFVGAILWAAFPIVVLVFMTRPQVRQWYDAA